MAADVHPSPYRLDCSIAMPHKLYFCTSPAGVLEGKIDRQCRVDLPGGPLYIEWGAQDNKIYMTGPAEVVFNGSAVLQ